MEKIQEYNDQGFLDLNLKHSSRSNSLAVLNRMKLNEHNEKSGFDLSDYFQAMVHSCICLTLGQFFYCHVFSIIIFKFTKGMAAYVSKFQQRKKIISHRLSKQKANDPSNCQKFHAKYVFWTTSLLLVAFPLANIHFIDVDMSLSPQ